MKQKTRVIASPSILKKTAHSQSMAFTPKPKVKKKPKFKATTEPGVPPSIEDFSKLSWQEIVKTPLMKDYGKVSNQPRRRTRRAR